MIQIHRGCWILFSPESTKGEPIQLQFCNGKKIDQLRSRPWRNEKLLPHIPDKLIKFDPFQATAFRLTRSCKTYRLPPLGSINLINHYEMKWTIFSPRTLIAARSTLQRALSVLDMIWFGGFYGPRTKFYEILQIVSWVISFDLRLTSC